MGVVTLKSPGGVCLVRGFPHLSTNQCINLISAAFSLIGVLLVLLQFTCNLT